MSSVRFILTQAAVYMISWNCNKLTYIYAGVRITNARGRLQGPIPCHILFVWLAAVDPVLIS